MYATSYVNYISAAIVPVVVVVIPAVVVPDAGPAVGEPYSQEQC